MNRDDVQYAVETLNFTKSLPHSLQPKFVNMIAKCAKAHVVPKSTPLFIEGDTEGDEGYILLEGEVVVRSMQKPEFSVWGPELIGETKQFNPNSVRTATVEAAEDLKTLVFQWSDFWKVARRHLDHREAEQLKEALSNYAWEHFSG